MFEVEPARLEQMVSDALDALPDEFRRRLDNVAILVEDQPTRRDLMQAGVHGGTLLGLYRGIPLSARDSGYGMIPPDRIVLFQQPLERLARDERHLNQLVRRTVFHEIAHHFGISDARLRELGAY